MASSSAHSEQVVCVTHEAIVKNPDGKKVKRLKLQVWLYTCAPTHICTALDAPQTKLICSPNSLFTSVIFRNLRDG